MWKMKEKLTQTSLYKQASKVEKAAETRKKMENSHILHKNWMLFFTHHLTSLLLYFYSQYIIYAMLIFYIYSFHFKYKPHADEFQIQSIESTF